MENAKKNNRTFIAPGVIETILKGIPLAKRYKVTEDEWKNIVSFPQLVLDRTSDCLKHNSWVTVDTE